MPTQVKSRGALATTNVSPQEGYNFDGYTIEHGHLPVYQSYLSKPTKSRRAKPADLFRGATPWRVEHTIHRYTSSGYTYRRDGGVWSYSGPSSYWSSAPSCPHPVGPDSLVLSNLDLKLRGKINSEKVDLLAACAEAHKAADLVFGLARDIVSSFGALRRGQPAAAVRRMLSDPRTRYDRAIAKRWLELQWGWLPTISDIYGAAEALATRVNEGVYHYYRVSHREDKTYVPSPLQGSGSWTRIHRARARVKFDSAQLVQLSSLGVTNPPASVYQLLPWSFVADWVSNTGDILAGLDALLGVSEVVVQRGVAVYVTCGWTVPQGGGGVTTTRLSQRLGVGSSLSFGTLAFKGPLDTNSPGTRFANAAGLVRQLWR